MTSSPTPRTAADLEPGPRSLLDAMLATGATATFEPSDSGYTSQCSYGTAVVPGTGVNGVPREYERGTWTVVELTWAEPGIAATDLAEAAGCAEPGWAVHQSRTINRARIFSHPRITPQNGDALTDGRGIVLMLTSAGSRTGLGRDRWDQRGSIHIYRDEDRTNRVGLFG